MTRKLFLILIFLSITWTSRAQSFNAWNEFAKTKFEPKFDEKLSEYVFHPDFPASLVSLAGKEITIEGYYVPFAPDDQDYIVISKFPMSQCFFCGGGGPESIAEVNFLKPPGRFQVDDLITVRGKLQLNADDLDHVNFILVQAVLLTD